MDFEAQSLIAIANLIATTRLLQQLILINQVAELLSTLLMKNIHHQLVSDDKLYSSAIQSSSVFTKRRIVLNLNL